ncbi:SDR family NAD(P)-dependent oxidoreductase [Alkalicoccus luteus]|uniref:SDR family oxidoreductase n=1 Tax=Alkalicoccus luteus TaxID=1237094 RepID=A0A969PP43_9BACI|nr:SDR family oxidoreductase [Alkalicoccus luteus]NJP37805.1 SDR family oxidoreductase [Alkalicoccus luteus]
MELNLRNKRVLITGGSKGIGFGIAEAFIKEGAKTAVIARGEDGLKQAAAELPGLQTIQADVSNEDEREQSFQQALNMLGGIDILVNNAGGSAGSTHLATTVDTFRGAMELNYFSALHYSQLACKGMKKNGSGVILNISSIFGRESGGKPSYNSAKAAMISMTKSLADEVIKDGIRVNGIAPGSILHPTGNWQKRLDENPDKINRFVEQEIPAGRFGTVQEVADAAVFLCSERASWIVGATINVDGGQSRSNF